MGSEIRNSSFGIRVCVWGLGQKSTCFRDDKRRKSEIWLNRNDLQCPFGNPERQLQCSRPTSETLCPAE